MTCAHIVMHTIEITAPTMSTATMTTVSTTAKEERSGERERETLRQNNTRIDFSCCAVMFIIGTVRVDGGGYVYVCAVCKHVLCLRAEKKLVQKFTTHLSELLFYIWSLHVFFCPRFISFVCYFSSIFRFRWTKTGKNREGATRDERIAGEEERKLLVTFILVTSMYLSVATV